MSVRAPDQDLVPEPEDEVEKRSQAAQHQRQIVVLVVLLLLLLLLSHPRPAFAADGQGPPHGPDDLIEAGTLGPSLPARPAEPGCGGRLGLLSPRWALRYCGGGPGTQVSALPEGSPLPRARWAGRGAGFSLGGWHREAGAPEKVKSPENLRCWIVNLPGKVGCFIPV